MNTLQPYDSINESDIAIIGMSCRFPGAESVDAFWQNLQNGIESVSLFSQEELLASGVDPALLENPNYVKARGVLPDIDLFDASFFGFSPGEAEAMDPQHRLFLEEAWKVIESAGYNPETYPGLIGVYAGLNMNSYLLNNLYLRLNFEDLTSMYPIIIGNSNDFLTTRVSYKLNLRGPSVNVQTACSTSLVALHLASQGLLDGECDIALAGGVSIMVPQKIGYVYQEGLIFSPDGHCRAFDAQAKGTVSGSGIGLVVLKRLTEAITDGDYIHAIIKGSAINNDGSLKVGYTAPGINGQTGVILEAQAVAGIDVETITYIEAHGTGTELGDPIEIKALTQAFRKHTQKKRFCAIGSVKTNFGHLDAAAGIAGLIKTVLMLEHKQIPPSLNFDHPNPQIDFNNSPFYVNTTLSEWKKPVLDSDQGYDTIPRRAGVSSFGFGGTNAHVVLEEFDSQKLQVESQNSKSRSEQLLILSARTESALDKATANLIEHLEQHPDVNFADVAYTLQIGRQAFNHRRILVCRSSDEAIKLLSTLKPKRVLTHFRKPDRRPIVFMFSGQGAQYVNMGLELYEAESTFHEQVDHCLEILKPLIEFDLRHILYPDKEHLEQAEQQLEQTAVTQPALFVIEYALAKLWTKWGISPHAMIGHSIGEYVAACLADVLSLEDALTLVAARGKLMQTLPKGSMLSVQLSEQEVQPLLGQKLSLAAINAPSLCVVSGPTELVDALQTYLKNQGIGCLRLHTSHAFHSKMMDPILEEFTEQVNQITLNPPQIPWVSTVTGTWVTAKDVTTPDYWIRNLRRTVRFAEGLQHLLQEPAQILLEIGPGRTLSTLARRCLKEKEYPSGSPQGERLTPAPSQEGMILTNPSQSEIAEQVILSSLRHPQDKQSDEELLLTILGKLWLEGVRIDWQKFYTGEKRQRLPLPTYPFERQHYWIESTGQKLTSRTPQSLSKKPDVADWFYIPSWKRSVCSQAHSKMERRSWLVFLDECGLGPRLVERLKQNSQDVISVTIGSEFRKLNDWEYVLNPRQPENYDTLLKELQASEKSLNVILHLWNVTKNGHQELEPERLNSAQDVGFYSLLFLAQALGKQRFSSEMQFAVISNNMQEVIGGDLLYPEKATVLGPIRVIPQEFPNIHCRSIDLVLPKDVGEPSTEKLIEQLLSEVAAPSPDPVIAYRGDYRWVQTFEPVRLAKPAKEISRLRKGGVYLITGGLGGIGFVLAEYLAKAVQAKLILTGRSALPVREDWQHWLDTHDEHDSTSHKILKVRQLEALGAKVLIMRADVADKQRMQEVISQTKEHFGSINGVIHAAGVPGGGIIQQKTPKIAQSILTPKVKGTLLLGYLFKNVQLDFFVLCSSLASILGEFGQVDYCSANAFLDAFAHYNPSSNYGVSTICINWGAWQEVGMAVNTTLPGELQKWRTENLRQGILPKEGIDAFSRILGSPLPQVLVSTQDFLMQLKQRNTFNVLHLSKVLEKADLSKPGHPRPKLSNAYTAPRNQAEQTLTEIWQESLSIEQVGINDDFFELGGDSLLATQLIARIQRQFGRNLPLATLLQSPTIAHLANILGQQTDVRPWSPVVILQPEGAKPPLFCVHPAGGNVFCYSTLAHFLGSDQPFYGLQAKGIEKGQKPFTRVEEIAVYYLNAVQGVQPQGPYFFAGWSFGGLVALEMAQQLYARGQCVSLLALLDTPAPQPGVLAELLDQDDVTLIVNQFSSVKDMRLSLEHLQQLSPDEQLVYTIEEAKRVNIISPDFGLDSARRLLQIFKINVRAAQNYVFKQRYPGKITFFSPIDQNLDQNWEEFAIQEREIHIVPGNHHTMMLEPHVQVLAKKLQTCLKRAQAGE